MNDSENMNGKEKVSTTEVEEEPNCGEKFTFVTNPSSVEKLSPNAEEHDVSEANVKPVRRQSQSGPLTSRTVVSHSASEKGQIFERFVP